MTSLELIRCLYRTSDLFVYLVLLWQELKRFPSLQAELTQAAIEALERMRDDSKKTALRLVDMEASYFTVDFFRKLPQEIEKGGNPAASTSDRYTDGHLRRIGEFFSRGCMLKYVGYELSTASMFQFRLSSISSMDYLQKKATCLYSSFNFFCGHFSLLLVLSRWPTQISQVQTCQHILLWSVIC